MAPWQRFVTTHGLKAEKLSDPTPETSNEASNIRIATTEQDARMSSVLTLLHRAHPTRLEALYVVDTLRNGTLTEQLVLVANAVLGSDSTVSKTEFSAVLDALAVLLFSPHYSTLSQSARVGQMANLLFREDVKVPLALLGPHLEKQRDLLNALWSNLGESTRKPNSTSSDE